MRCYWKGDAGLLPAFARAMLGSADLFEHQGRKPWASVNFITAHDGFTLADLWSYNAKHNEANGEDNRDGHDDNRSWNCGVEGPTDDPAILDLRDRHAAQHHGDAAAVAGHADAPHGRRDRPHAERQQQRLLPGQRDRLAEVEERRRARPRLHGVRARLIRLRKRYPILRANRFLHGEPVDEKGTRSVVWFRPDGREMDRAVLGRPNARVIGMLLSGRRRGSSSSSAPTTSRSRSRCRSRT